MATASEGISSLDHSNSNNNSSFGQYRLTQFVDNAPRPNATIAHPATVKPNDNHNTITTTHAGSMAGSASGRNTTPAMLGPSASARMADGNQLNMSNTFSPLELVEGVANPMLEGILGPNKDGRVRNPVPSKLKGKTDNKQGKFGVMHMGTTPVKKSESMGRDAAAERDAAARRTSENTASRAKAAQQEKYVPPKKRAYEEPMERPKTPPPAFTTPVVATREEVKPKGRPLAPEETKYEQARLLTLLRSINPITVVDQLCKAAAYFGGIPGAPPPDDGVFPESANTRETGALFIGWLSEIFPDLARSPEAPRTHETPVAGKKGRGRPRKSETGTPSHGGHGESSGSTNGINYGQAVAPPSWAFPTHAPAYDTGRQDYRASNEPLATPRIANPEPENPGNQTGFTPVPGNTGNPTSTPIPGKRGRGRPKGSKNKKGTAESQNAANREAQKQQQNNVIQQDMQGGEMATEQKPIPNFTSSVNNQAAVTPQGNHYSEQAFKPHSLEPPTQTPTQPQSTSNAPLVNEFGAEVLDGFHNPGAQNVQGTVSLSSSGGPVKAQGSGVKRKRAGPKQQPQVPPLVPQDATQSSKEVNELPPNGGGIDAVRDTSKWPQMESTPSAAPSSKRARQRPSMMSGSVDPPSRPHSASIASATPPFAPSTIPDSQASVSQQSQQSVSRPPAEGLEAHYERFANLSSNVSQSNVPSMTPQQVRQQKPAMQPQLQRQRSQQSNPREDQKSMSQAMAGRSTSTASTYYNQRSQGSNYSQQYPSHQPSEAYNSHQTSPHMSNTTYRTNSSHTLSQPSPQFPSTDINYRTASPHTVAHSSPAFSQAEPSYRASTAHTLSNPSAPYPARSQSSQPANPQPNQYGHFTDSSYIDLPTIESLPQNVNSASSTSTTGMYASSQNLGMGGGGSRPGGGSAGVGVSNTGLYGSGPNNLGNYDTNTNNLLRTTRAGNTAGVAAYGTPTGGLGNSASGYGTNPGGAASEQEMRERLLMRGMTRR